jgi:protein-disulfide isomerase
MFKKENRMTTIFVVVIVFFVGFAIWGAFSGGRAEKVAALPTTTDKTYNEAEQPIVGEEDAPVELVIFTDYQCPHCKTWYEVVYPELKTRLLDTGKASLRFVNYPVIGIPSTYAAMASEYVYKENPDGWHEFSADLYENQVALSNAKISELASSYLDGVSQEEIQQKLEEDQVFIEDVLADYNQGEEVGVSGTPYLLVDGQNVNHGNVQAIEQLVDEIINGE